MNLIIKIKSELSSTRGYFILCLCSIAIGLSLSKPLMSLGLLGLGILWLFDGDIKNKIKQFYKNKIVLVIGSIYIISLLGLIHTSNFDFAFDDLRRKIPLLLFPFFLSGFSPLTKKELYFILKVYIAGVVAATLWSLFVYLGGLGITFVNERYYSRFNSHIRFGLEIALAFFFTIIFFLRSSFIKKKILWASISVWLLFSLFLFNLFSGVVVLFATIFILLINFGLQTKHIRIKLLLLLSITILFCGLFLFINSSFKSFYLSKTKNTIPIKEISFTKDGHEYQKDSTTINNPLKENGYYIAKNIAWGELAAFWGTRSKLPFDGKDHKGQELKNTLIRFITSKGLRKDREGVESLSEEEVLAIENGISNVKYLNMNYFSIRAHKILWEYESYINGGNINGHSVLMRWEYWKTATKIIKKNMLFGVGTGDVQDAFNKQYEIDNSKLETKYRLRTHNQYLAYGVTFGLIGTLWFLICLFYPMVKVKKYKNYLYLSFFSIILLSMLTEDTLETQVGIYFFVFFNTLSLLQETKKNKIISNPLD